MQRKRALKSSLTLISGQLLGQGMVFLRNVIVARWLGPHNFGIGAMFVLVATLIDMTSNVGADKLLVQASDGEDPDLQRSAHFVHFVRGVSGGAMLLLLAGPVSRWLGVEEAVESFRWLALVPILGAFRHLDVCRFNRELRFFPEITVEISHQAVALVTSVTFAYFNPSYSAVLWSLITQWLVASLVSNLVAERPYQMRFNKGDLTRISRFGWPLLLNGIVMFAMFQGDRLIVGKGYGMTTLGIYAVALGLAMMPTIVVARMASSLLLPLLSKAAPNRTAFIRQCQLAGVVLGTISVGIASFMTIGGGPLMRLLYGERYRGAAEILVILSMAQGIFILRAGPGLAALANGDGVNSLVANLTRALGVIGSATAAHLGKSLECIALIALIGELLAFSASVIMAHLRNQAPLSSWVSGFVVYTGGCSVSYVIHREAVIGRPLTWIFAATAVSISIVAISAVCQPALREEVRTLVSNRMPLIAPSG